MFTDLTPVRVANLCAVLMLVLVMPAHAWEAKPLRDIAVYPARGAQAQVVSLNESRLAAEISGRILRLPLEPGQRVAPGALVARLDCSDHDLSVERARAAVQAGEARARLAALQLERAGKLAADNFLSRDALDTRAAEHDAARAEVAVQVASLKTAEATRRKCDIHAPFPAIVLERLAQEGELAAPGTPLVSLLDTSRIEVKAEVQAADAAGLERVGKAEFVSPAGRWPLRLVRLSPALGKTTRLLEARLRFVGPAAAAGSSGQVLWNTPEPHVPADLVVRRSGGLGVYLATGRNTRFHRLPAAQEGRPARAEGVRGTDQVVVRGFGELR